MRSIGLLFLVSAAAFGQRAPAARPAGVNTFGSATGFGNVVFPGTGHAPVVHRPISGAGIGLSGGTMGTYRGGRRSVIYVPYTVPLYFGEPNEPQITVMYPTPQIAPQVVINQNFAPDVVRPIVREYVSDSDGGIRVYEPAPAPSAAPTPTEENPTYLIAFKDHTIYAAVAYWVEGETLHYVTKQNTHNQVSLDLIDRELSLRLNRERSVDFRLPPPK